MTAVYITIDTEYAADFAGLGRAENFARSIACETPSGAVGVFHKMDVMERHGIRGVFFVDPMPALLYGREAIADVVGPIVERGHDVQLHCHTEWLALAGAASPVRGRSGRNLADFTLEDQQAILDWARGALVAAGAPAPVAFRAGNYGANDDTLRALAAIGLRYDTSHTPGIEGGACRISLARRHRRPLRHCGVIEVPTGCIRTLGGRLRHAQVTAISSREMLAAIRHARDHDLASFTIVSHSFELLCRERRRANAIVRRRFAALCEGLASMPGVESATYASRPPVADAMDAPRPVLPVSSIREGLRIAEQIIANGLYGAR
ncbi:polysaccharide deacetylase family protein [Pelagerythrobacter sp.]|uniref:polysaccharide deacetylase family protein n=1 Tax=Pelagerythrobacter sp. TaxID=2800702 RepID=UPI0035B33057